MINRVMIYCCPGTGGLFLTTVIGQILGRNVRAQISSTGHAHDLGRGNWKGSPEVCFTSYYWEQLYRPGFQIYYAHSMPRTFAEQNPDVAVLLIDADKQDFRKITELYVRKAWPDMWTEEEYNKWASPEYPPYSPDNIATSDIIVNDLVNDLEHTTVRKWYQDNAWVDSPYHIAFQTIMGVNNHDLVAELCAMLDRPEPQGIRDYVRNYQQQNQQLYFNAG